MSTYISVILGFLLKKHDLGFRSHSLSAPDSLLTMWWPLSSLLPLSIGGPSQRQWPTPSVLLVALVAAVARSYPRPPQALLVALARRRWARRSSRWWIHWCCGWIY